MAIRQLTPEEKEAFLREILDEIKANEEDPEYYANREKELEDEEQFLKEMLFQKRLARLSARGGNVTSTSQTLMPARHAQMDFFVADILDATPKDDGASMEHPIFALKAGDHRVREYERNGISVKVLPGRNGCATMHDKDIWIYCISQLVEAMNRKRSDVDRTVRFTAYDFLRATNRGTDGRAYERLGDALSRLQGTQIETNIKTANERERAGFGLLESWRVVERSSDNRMVAIEVTLPQWLWRSVESKHVLTLSRDYFRIRKTIHRRIYEIARKHCGTQASWKVSMTVLHQKSGSADRLPKFRAAIKALAEVNDLPGYTVAFEEGKDMVIFKPRDKTQFKGSIEDMMHGTGLF